MADTKIEWCDKVLEVTGGGTKLSPGCTHCWALKEVWRMAHNPLLGEKWQGLVEKKNGVLNWTGKIKCFEDAINIPFHRKEPTRYFIDSKADLFHEKVPFDFIDKVLYVMYLNIRHTFLILTKRAARMSEYFENGHLLRLRLLKLFPNYTPEARLCREWPLDNVHLGVSISTPDEMWKIKLLLQIPAAVRWLSIEPMLERIIIPEEYLGKEIDHYFGKVREKELTAEQFISGKYPDNFIDWVVVGCEKIGRSVGRPCKIEWIESIVDQCKAANVPVYIKQININGKVVKMPKDFPQELPERK